MTNVRPGMRIRVMRRIERRDGAWSTEVVGTILSPEPQPTGSWYVHGNNDKYWLVRVELQKDDGEVTLMTLYPNTQNTVVEA